MADEVAYDEVTLGDLVATLWRRKLVLVLSFLLVGSGAAAYTFLQAEQFESTATIAPLNYGSLSYGDLIKNFLDSRSTSSLVLASVGPELAASLGEERVDSQSAISKLSGSTRIDYSNFRATDERKIRVTVELPDASLAAETANTYLTVLLSDFRPYLVEYTSDALFSEYYDGNNPEDARRQAEQVAEERQYWLVLDPAAIPSNPSSPNVTLNLALGVVLGLMMGVFAVFALEYARNYKAKSSAPQAPPANQDSGAFRFRGK